MVGQQLQSGGGICSFESVDAHRADGKPDRASGNPIFLPALDVVNPVGSDCLALNEDGVLHHGALSISEKKTRVILFLEYSRIASN